METSSLPSEKENTHNLGNVRSRIHCLIGSILVVLLIWLICTYYNFIVSFIINFFQISTTFFLKFCEKIDTLSPLVHYIITSIIGVIFLYCFCGIFAERKMFMLEKISLPISGILLVTAFFYKFIDKFNNDGTVLDTSFCNTLTHVVGYSALIFSPLLFLCLLFYLEASRE